MWIFPAVLLLLFLLDTCRSSWETSFPHFVFIRTCPDPPGCSSRGLQASASLMLGITWSSSPRAGNALPLPKGLGGSLFPFQTSLGCVLP